MRISLMGGRDAIRLAITTLAFAFVTASGASATVIAAFPTDDRTIEDTNSDGVGDGLLSDTDGFLRTFGFTTVWRSALDFNILALAGDSITSASLFIYSGGTNISGATINVYGFVGNGTVQVTDGNQTSNLITSFVLGNPQTGYTLDVTSFVQSLASTNTQYAAFLLAPTTPGNIFSGADFCSVDQSIANCAGGTSNNPFNRPLLTVNFEAPEPTTLPLLATGLGLMGLLGWRRKFATSGKLTTSP